MQLVDSAAAFGICSARDIF